MDPKQRQQIQEKIARIEANALERSSSRAMRQISTDYYMFFLLIGFDDTTREMLNSNIQSMLRNRDVYGYAAIQGEQDLEKIGRWMTGRLSQAARSHANVGDLNTVFIAPVQAVGTGNTELFEKTTQVIGDCVQYLHKEAYWQPFLMLRHGPNSAKENTQAIMAMEHWLHDSRDGIVNRCCLLSQRDNAGFEIPIENLMHTISMTAIMQIAYLRDQGNEVADAKSSIRRRVARDLYGESRNDLFFTSRCVTVENPVRTLTLHRIRSAFDYFCGETDETSKNALAQMKYNFLGSVVNHNLEKLPRINGRISLIPIYSVMDGPELENRLRDFAAKTYKDPLVGESARNTLLRYGIPAFLDEYFGNNGALRELVTIDPKRIKLPANVYAPEIEHWFPPKKVAAKFTNPAYATVFQWCGRLVQEYGATAFIELVRTIAGKSDSDEYCVKKGAEKLLIDLEEIREMLEERIRQLGSIETILLTGKSEVLKNAEDLSNAWLKDFSVNHPTQMREQNRQFDSAIMRSLTKQVVELPEDYWQREDQDELIALLDACEIAISDATDNNASYLKELSDICYNKDLLKEFFKIIRRGWSYSIQFLGGGELHGDTAIMLGDMHNVFCQKLKEDIHAQSASVRGYDRIDILHLSAAFAPDKLHSWMDNATEDEKEVQFG